MPDSVATLPPGVRVRGGRFLGCPHNRVKSNPVDTAVQACPEELDLNADRGLAFALPCCRAEERSFQQNASSLPSGWVELPGTARRSTPSYFHFGRIVTR